MWTERALAAGLAVVVMAAPLAAQTPSPAPMSAIDWLSDTVVEPLQPPRSPVAEAVTTEEISVATLETLAIDGVGLLPPNVTGLPRDFWGPTNTRDLVQALAAQSLDLPPPARSLLFRILLAELDPPVDAGPDHALFLARIDTLLRFGALEQAQALLERAGPKDAALFRRWFDVSLLTGNEDRACAVLRAAPDIAPTFAARVFCLARGNDWAAAALSLDTARALGLIGAADEALLARFLDPELFDDGPITDLPSPITPLAYRLLAALGEAPSPSTMPLAFAHAALDPVSGWKQRIEAAERLVLYGGLAPRQLFALYTERGPAASGGVWERVRAVQQLDAALLGGDIGAVWQALPRVASELDAVGLTEAFAQHYGARLAALPPPKSPAALRDRMVLLSPEAEAFADSVSDPFLAGIARGMIEGPPPSDSLRQAIAAAFSAQATSTDTMTETLIREDRLGEATLRALLALGAARPDPGDVETGLAVLRRLGFEAIARQTALSLLLAPES